MDIYYNRVNYMFCRFDFYDGICILFLCVSSIVSDDDGKAEAVFNCDDG